MVFLKARFAGFGYFKEKSTHVFGFFTDSKLLAMHLRFQTKEPFISVRFKKMVFLLVGVFPLTNQMSLSQALVFIKQMDCSRNGVIWVDRADGKISRTVKLLWKN